MEEINKFLIVLPYYRRPSIVLNALDSIKNLNYQNWELSFIDDSGDDSFKETLLNFGLDNSKIKYTAIYDSDEAKQLNNGSRHGEFMNNSILESDADIIIILCDDDALLNNSLTDLNQFYTNNPHINWAYSLVTYYNPLIETYRDATPDLTRIGGNSVHCLNTNVGTFNPSGNCDGSQVTYRRTLITNQLGFPSPTTKNLDAHIFNQLFDAYGGCYFTGIFVQCKGAHREQLGVRESTWINLN
jgi:glycosyltransferase involved in cell wall biosynthesis